MGDPATVELELSSHERDVLALLAHGYTSAAVASELDVSVRTVTRWEGAACRRLGVATRIAAAAEAARRGII